jgi:hypothetical protein
MMSVLCLPTYLLLQNLFQRYSSLSYIFPFHFCSVFHFVGGFQFGEEEEKQTLNVELTLSSGGIKEKRRVEG